jgi:hypothetical protein
VRDESGSALPGVSVYEKGSGDVVVTDVDGRFALDVASLPATVVAFLGGFEAVTVTIAGAEADIRLKFAAVTENLTVTARAPRSASGSTYDMRPLDVLRTPGAQADLFRALQLLPGVAKVDDGAGLFVRGGDISEVRVMLDGATIDHPFRYESPSGGQFGSVSPMLLEGLTFATGGFSARYGNALSAVLDLRGLGKPSSTAWSATGGLAGLSARAALPGSASSGVRASGNFSSTKLLFAVNGKPRDFDQLPSSWDINGSGHLESPAFGTLKVFAMTQRDRVGVDIRKDNFAGFLHSHSSQSIGAASWKKLAGEWQLNASFGANAYSRGTDLGVIDLTTSDRRISTRFDAARLFGQLLLRTGVDADRAGTRITGTKPLRGNDYAGSSGSVAFDVDYADTHAGSYAELERALGRVTTTAGMRIDADRLLGATTFDPRINMTVALPRDQKLRVAWGIYHQAPVASYFDREGGADRLESMKARHWVLGYEYGSADGPLFVRAEAYDKRYGKLPVEDATHGFASTGYGFARGVDLFAAKKWQKLELRAAYSVLSARRRWTSYDQQRRFDLPAGTWRPDFEIPRSLSVVANAQLTASLSGGLALVSASGRPNTPVIGATPTASGFVPQYGAINSERFPSYRRCDLNLTWRAKPIGETSILYFVALGNATGRKNVTEYAYSTDYTSREPVVSLAPRSFYFGFTLFQ